MFAYRFFGHDLLAYNLPFGRKMIPEEQRPGAFCTGRE
jgi:hypothetical protein